MSWVASFLSRTASEDPSATIAIWLGPSYSKHPLPGFWMTKSPLVLLPSGPTWTKFPTSVCSDDRYELTLAACAFWPASKVAKILAGTLRWGSGITGFGGACVAPVVVGPFWESCALICTPPSRAFGAGFGIGTFCESEGGAAAATDAATTSASP